MVEASWADGLSEREDWRSFQMKRDEESTEAVNEHSRTRELKRKCSEGKSGH